MCSANVQPPFLTAEQTEQAFYEAFRHCDSRAMAVVWADDDVICIHPGTQAISGYDAVLRSWSNIFANDGLPEIQINLLESTATQELVVHTVEEVIATGNETYASVLATNVYRKYAEGWLMVKHHGSLVKTPADSHTIQ
jgi:ketosteroid isomerase-like protein